MYATITRTNSGLSSSASLLMCLHFESEMAIGNRLLQKTNKYPNTEGEFHNCTNLRELINAIAYIQP
jgi:hypothetical protein